MEPDRIKKGDMVYLKSDLELDWPMLVVAIGAGQCECLWLDINGVLNAAKLPEDALLVNEPAGE